MKILFSILLLLFSFSLFANEDQICDKFKNTIENIDTDIGLIDMSGNYQPGVKEMFTEEEEYYLAPANIDMTFKPRIVSVDIKKGIVKFDYFLFCNFKLFKYKVSVNNNNFLINNLQFFIFFFKKKVN